MWCLPLCDFWSSPAMIADAFEIGSWHQSQMQKWAHGTSETNSHLGRKLQIFINEKKCEFIQFSVKVKRFHCSTYGCNLFVHQNLPVASKPTTLSFWAGPSNILLDLSFIQVVALSVSHSRSIAFTEILTNQGWGLFLAIIHSVHSVHSDVLVNYKEALAE